MTLAPPTTMEVGRPRPHGDPVRDQYPGACVRSPWSDDLLSGKRDREQSTVDGSWWSQGSSTVWVMATAFEVSNPWAWSWCPARLNPVTEDPDITDGVDPYPYPERPSWPAVFAAVTAAVRQAETLLTDELTAWATVTIPFDLDPTSHHVVRDWLRPPGVGVWWDIHGDGTAAVGDGRHRLYAACAAGVKEPLPVQVGELRFLRGALIDSGEEDLRCRIAEDMPAILDRIRAWVGSAEDFRACNSVLLANLDVAVRMFPALKPLRSESSRLGRGGHRAADLSWAIRVGSGS